MQSNNARRVLYFLSMVTGLFGVGIIFIDFNDNIIRSIGVAVVMVALYLLHLSSRRTHVYPVGQLGNSNLRNHSNKPGRIAWFLCVSMLVVVCASFWFMYEDANNGYHNAWPLYAFAISGQALVIVIAYIFGAYIWRMFKR